MPELNKLGKLGKLGSRDFASSRASAAKLGVAKLRATAICALELP